ncbi:response regulator [Spirosoma radiotolerans]|uniref:response regulator n=1 Tax=Spirosoma radiotolerans TaxID=1379870 RepID=UPI000696E8AB|nr:response regulator [Spirosoma radiotolerans]
MNTTAYWVALLDEDEDDFVFWQHGFRTWATEGELKWYSSAERFLSEATASPTKPSAIVLDGVVPKGEEAAWLKTFLSHICCANTPVFMLVGQSNEEDRQRYLDQGATDYLIKPTSSEELEKIVKLLVPNRGNISL